jgi:hypothetical protein
MPVKQGWGSSPQGEPSVSNVLALAATGINVARLPTVEENELSNLDRDDLKDWVRRSKRKKEKNSLAFMSASGLPRFQFHNGRILSKPCSFRFSVDIAEQEYKLLNFTHDGTSYEHFQVFEPGGTVIRAALKHSALIPFGYVRDADCYRYFFKPARSDIIAVVVSLMGDSMELLSRGLNRYLICRKIDMSPIGVTELLDHTVVERAGITGLDGDTDSILNYGSYLHTNTAFPMEIMSRIYGKLRCERPARIRRNLRSFPFFRRGHKTIPAGRTTRFVGSKSIRRLKLTINDNPDAIVALQRINLTAKDPYIMIESIPDDFSEEDL